MNITLDVIIHGLQGSRVNLVSLCLVTRAGLGHVRSVRVIRVNSKCDYPIRGRQLGGTHGTRRTNSNYDWFRTRRSNFRRLVLPFRNGRAVLIITNDPRTLSMSSILVLCSSSVRQMERLLKVRAVGHVPSVLLVIDNVRVSVQRREGAILLRGLLLSRLTSQLRVVTRRFGDPRFRRSFLYFANIRLSRATYNGASNLHMKFLRVDVSLPRVFPKSGTFASGLGKVFH